MAEDNIYLINDLGERRWVPRTELPDWQVAGFRPESEAETEKVRLKKEYGDRPFAAAAQGAAEVISFGTIDPLLMALDPEGTQQTPEQNPGGYTAGQLGAFVVGGGTGLLKGAARAGEAVEGAILAGGERTFGRELAGTVAKGATENALIGGGTGISELSRSGDPITAEGAVSTIGSNMLMGGVLGGGTNAALKVGGKMLTEGSSYAKKLIGDGVDGIAGAAKADDVAAKEAEAAAARKAEFPEVDSFDQATTAKETARHEEAMKAKKATDLAENMAAQKAEEAAMVEAKKAATDVAWDKAKVYKEYNKANFIQVDDAELAKHLGKGSKITTSLDSPSAFKKSMGAGRFQNALGEQEEAYRRVIAGSEGVLDTAGARQQALLDSLPTVMPEPPPVTKPRMDAGGRRIGKVPEPEVPRATLTPEASDAYRGWLGEKRPTKASERLVKLTEPELVAFRSAVQASEALPVEVLRVTKATEQLEKNLEMKAVLEDLQAEAKSARLDELKVQHEQIKGDTTPDPYLVRLKQRSAELQERSLTRDIMTGAGAVMGGSAGFALAGPAGAAAGGLGMREMMGRIFDRFGRGIKKANDVRQKSIAKSIGSMFTKGAKVAKSAIPKASNIVPIIAYSHPEHVNAVMGPPKYAKSKDATVNAFHERKRELDAITEKKPDGSFAMRMYDMTELGERLAAVWAISPHLANKIELAQQQKVAYLASKVPRDPTPPHLALGPMSWEPNHAEIAKFARIMQVAEDPLPAVERVADGTCTPDDVETLKAVWPAHYDDIRRQCMDHAMRLQATMPYQQRLSLSILFDMPVDPALTQEVLGVFQRKVQGEGGGGAGGGGAPPQQNKPLPTGMIQPTEAQRMSAK